MAPDSSRSVAAILNNIFFVIVGLAVVITAIVIAVVKL